MSRRRWVRLDNASNIFLAARNDTDTKVFRISAEMEHEVRPDLLQQALDTVYERYPLYHAVLRSGVFWYYLQDSDLRPTVAEEHQYTCAPIYQADRRTLLFRVIYYRRRIMLEIFHALSDGTGALWFLSDLVAEYLRLGFPDERADSGAQQLEVRDVGESAEAFPPPSPEPIHELTEDSFGHYFRKRPNTSDAPPPETENGEAPAQQPGSGARRSAIFSTGARVYRPRGTRAPDNRTRLVEVTAPASDVLALARAEGASLTIYLTALFLESIRATAPRPEEVRTVAASIPVNLRQFFPSDSARNFFATVRVEHRYGRGPDDLGSICRSLERQFRPKASREELEARLRRLIEFERMAVLRVVPRVLKDALLKLINRGNNRSLTVAVSNLGQVRLPGVDDHVERLLFHVSAARPQFCVISHAGLLTISFTSPFVETDHVREFVRHLTARGVPVTVAAARVTEREIAEAGS